ncbi:hypothetical protein MUK72_15410 (plasmid) [Halococcus dombrowskii]|jgi:hypothetical protein|uniref:Cyclic nucleotide-binding domain-containing protein n=1 Tax=Halococcus dombrowskii TaxID=179637 RepID=A0AAV3SDK1_HALDO|nr:hypothetical protein [Halococcus dombrowskii]UOO96583.1 hypothetical protein MUK72_15410 [Halococcus dombrowskii]
MNRDAQPSTETDQREIIITDTAKSKVYRLHSESQLVENIRNQPGAVYQKGDSDEYHLVKNGQVIVIVVEPEKYVVVTQMHNHPDYNNRDIYQEVRELP